MGSGSVDAEIIVVGGGHNGLICAAYLARAGHDTLLVEARDAVGGCASTVDALGARFNICNCDHTFIRAMPIIDDLETWCDERGIEKVTDLIGAVKDDDMEMDPLVAASHGV